MVPPTFWKYLWMSIFYNLHLYCNRVIEAVLFICASFIIWSRSGCFVGRVFAMHHNLTVCLCLSLLQMLRSLEYMAGLSAPEWWSSVKSFLYFGSRHPGGVLCVITALRHTHTHTHTHWCRASPSHSGPGRPLISKRLMRPCPGAGGLAQRR